MRTYYNEIDPFLCGWLENLIAAGELPDGVVDCRPVEEVEPSDLDGFGHVHFFAGIGGWAFAAKLARWPDDLPLWTGSCPCQPLSITGRRKGHADERHLWPVFGNLVAECRPAILAGEQVASPLGREWMSAVRFDLERMDYAVGAADLPAAGVGAPHIRQRVYYLGHAYRAGLAQRTGTAGNQGSIRRAQEGQDAGSTSPWGNFVYLLCDDEKTRPTQPGLLPLAHGVSNRVGQIRGYGNAICPQVGSIFLASFLDTLKE